MSETHDDAHAAAIKNPKQFLTSTILAFVLPIFIIIGLVVFVTSGNKPMAGVENPEMAIAQRIQKIGNVEVRDANRPLRSGEDVYKGQCAACHATGAAGAPKLGDASEWGPRIKTGFEALVQSALKGKGAMAPQGGGDFDDTEIARGVAYMANAAGAKFAEPERPKAEGDAAKLAPPTFLPPLYQPAMCRLARFQCVCKSAGLSTKPCAAGKSAARTSRGVQRPWSICCAAMATSRLCTRPKPRAASRYTRPHSSTRQSRTLAARSPVCATAVPSASRRQINGATSSSTYTRCGPF